MKKRRSGFTIMKQLIVLVKPLTPVMILGITLGVIGYLCAIFLTIFGAFGVIKGVYELSDMAYPAGMPALITGSWTHLFTWILVTAFARGFLHYGEQYCNHYIAFRILAIIRHKVFAALRKLCPAKLEGREKGNLISIITSDIELLEVFYAHTISPIAIALIVSVIMVIFIGRQSAAAGIIACIGYLIVGIAIPVWNGKRSSDAGMELRNGMGDLNSYVLDSLYGIDETTQYGQGEKQLKEVDERSGKLAAMQKRLNRFEGSSTALTNLVIQIFSWGMLFVMLLLYRNGSASFGTMLTASVAMMGSFGPVRALSSLSNNLNQTFASGERVLSLLEETPQVDEVSSRESTAFNGAEMDHVSFAYDNDNILENFSIEIPKGKIIGLHGASGSGKSTVLKLLMRFWDVQTGSVKISGRDVRDINTDDLRSMESYVTQDTVLFHDTIAKNIAMAKLDASQEEIESAARKAGIHDFIMNLPKGYQTNVGELGDTLSDGEKQRIGLARAFLHDSDLILLDEPTSNLDSLNEGIILKSVNEEKENRTVVLVSHRQSTMSIADKVYHMQNGRLS